MAKVYCSISIIILSLFIISSCGPGSPPSMNSPAFQITIGVDPLEGGTVLPESEEVNQGDPVIISATPNEGWLFDSWQGDHTGSSNPDTVMVNSDKEIKALFMKRIYPLTITIEGEGIVSEKIVQPKTADYPHGTTVELTAEPSDGWRFTEWTGENSNVENPIQIVVENEKEVTAHFEKMFFSLTIEVEGNGSVDKVLQSGNESDGLYEFDSVVDLTASADVGWGFMGWEGDLNDDQNPQSVTINGDKTVTAVFVQSNSDFAGGNGTVSDPYRVSTIDHLQNVDEDKYIDKHFIQINNINAASTSNWNRGQGFKPIGSDSSPFRGTYDGNGYEISRLTINRNDEDNVGLFRSVEEGIIKNTGIRNANILGDEVVGGLVGNNNGQIINSDVHGTVGGEEIVGGLIGRNQGQVNDSYALADVSGKDEVGGLAGQNHREIAGSYSDGSVKGEDRIGGLAGYNSGKIINSYSKSDVNGDEEVGGLIGENRSSGAVESSYSTGNVSGDGQVGGLIGTNRGKIKSSYWDTQSTGKRNATGRGRSGGATGLKTSEMKGNSAKENMSEFDWDDIWRWTSDYPILRWQER